MKKAVLTLSILPLLAATSYHAAAGDREWATAGKVLTGLVAAQVISQAVHPAPYYAPAPVLYGRQAVFVHLAPTIVYPAPVYVQPAPVYYPAQPVVYVRTAPIFVAPPVFCPPRPVFSFHVGFGHHGRSHRHHHRH